MSYMFGYKIKEISQDHKECGFPLNSINRIIAKLEEAKIDYMIIDRRNNYDVEECVEFKKENNYEKYYENASKYVRRKRRKQAINEFLENSIKKENCIEILNSIESIIDERRKI